MVKTLQQVTQKKNLTGEDKLKVINAVENYAGKKRVVPRTDGGKQSLDLAYQAMEAVVPTKREDYEVRAKFLGEHQGNIQRLRDAMVRDGLRPQPQRADSLAEIDVHQNNGPGYNM